MLSNIHQPKKKEQNEETLTQQRTSQVLLVGKLETNFFLKIMFNYDVFLYRLGLGLRNNMWIISIYSGTD